MQAGQLDDQRQFAAPAQAFDTALQPGRIAVAALEHKTGDTGGAVEGCGNLTAVFAAEGHQHWDGEFGPGISQFAFNPSQRYVGFSRPIDGPTRCFDQLCGAACAA